MPVADSATIIAPRIGWDPWVLGVVINPLPVSPAQDQDKEIKVHCTQTVLIITQLKVPDPLMDCTDHGQP